MRMGRLGIRSTQTPAGRLMRMNGANSITPSSATSNALTSSVMIATSGRASPVTCEPTWLIVSADQSFRKSGCRHRPPLGHRFRMLRPVPRL